MFFHRSEMPKYSFLSTYLQLLPVPNDLAISLLDPWVASTSGRSPGVYIFQKIQISI